VPLLPRSHILTGNNAMWKRMQPWDLQSSCSRQMHCSSSPQSRWTQHIRPNSGGTLDGTTAASGFGMVTYVAVAADMSATAAA
jgi:hypothetical protein